LRGRYSAARVVWNHGRLRGLEEAGGEALREGGRSVVRIGLQPDPYLEQGGGRATRKRVVFHAELHARLADFRGASPNQAT